MFRFLLIFIMLLIPCLASADMKPYVTFSGAVPIGSSTQDIEGVGSALGRIDRVGKPAEYPLESSDGFRAGFAAGVRVNRFRFELEYAYRESSLESEDGGKVPVHNLGGEEFSTSGSIQSSDLIANGNIDNNLNTFMANAYFDLLKVSKFSLYGGLGIGAAWGHQSIDNIDLQFRVENINPSDSHFGDFETFSIEGREDIQVTKNQSNFAYQLMAGLTYDFTENISSDIEYRYLDAGFISKNEIGLGLRYTF